MPAWIEIVLNYGTIGILIVLFVLFLTGKLLSKKAVDQLIAMWKKALDSVAESYQISMKEVSERHKEAITSLVEKQKETIALVCKHTEDTISDLKDVIQLFRKKNGIPKRIKKKKGG